MRKIVVLPDPLGPISASFLAWPHRDIQSPEDLDRAEGLLDFIEFDDVALRHLLAIFRDHEAVTCRRGP